MPGTRESYLSQRGLMLPAAPKPAASYIPFTRSGKILYIAGQVPRIESKPAFVGLLGADISLEEGQKAAQLCALNIMAQIKAAAGDLDRVASVLRLVGYVASTSSFNEHHKVMNGASELIADVFGESGRHARTSVGVAALPQGVPVEVEATIELL